MIRFASKMTLILGIAFLANLSSPIEMEAADPPERVRCPSSVTVDVEHKLPGPWWSTAQGGEVVATRIDNWGSDTMLVCVYDLNGIKWEVVRRQVPFRNCKQTGNSFSCRR